MNPLVSFINNHHPPCNNFHCGTCGGITHFFTLVQKQFPDKVELIKHLKAFTGKDAILLTRKSRSVYAIIISLFREEQRDLFEYWAENLVDDPDLAFEVLKWCKFRIPTKLKEQLIRNAETCFLKSRSARNELRRSLRFCFEDDIQLPDSIITVIQADKEEEREKYRADREEEREKYRLEELACKKRTEYYKTFLEKPFLQRLHLIISDEELDWNINMARRRYLKNAQMITSDQKLDRERPRHQKDVQNDLDPWDEWIKWRSALSKCSAQDFASLNLEEVQSLIDLCLKVYDIDCHDALKYLYDRRHCLRIEAMEQFRQDYGHLTPEEQLNILLSKFVCIEHFPIELTNAVTHEWLSSLSEFDKNLFLSMLKQTRLRKWVKVRDRL